MTFIAWSGELMGGAGLVKASAMVASSAIAFGSKAGSVASPPRTARLETGDRSILFIVSSPAVVGHGSLPDGGPVDLVQADVHRSRDIQRFDGSSPGDGE